MHIVGYESEERDKAQKQLANAFWEIATEKFDSLVRVARLAVEQDAAGSRSRSLEHLTHATRIC